MGHLPRPWSRERVLVVGLKAAGAVTAAIDGHPRARCIVAGVVDDVEEGFPPAGPPLLGPLSRFAEIVEEVRPDRVLVGLAERRARAPMRVLVESCIARGIAVEDAEEFQERLAGKVAIESLAPAVIVFGQRFRPSRIEQFLARAIGVCVAAVGLVISAPILLLIAAAVKIDSRGPVLFEQMRIGAHGRPFRLLKFRTMRTGARGSEWERDNRDRVTRVGKWLRAVRLDELPQFVNVLRGEMNLVGPRPHPVSNFELFTLVARNMNERTGSPVSCYALRTMVRPGMTGWAQVRYRYANDLDEEMEKLRYDLYYVKHVSVLLDLRIMLETMRVVVLGYRTAKDRPAIPQPAPAPALALSSGINQGHAA
jgi:exopolysaccharide biosynthesis polyprenyl glycosylphosphotransferase